MPLPRDVPRFLLSFILPGILGGLFAFLAANFWFYYFGQYVFPGMPARAWMPDALSFMLIDAWVGAGCGYAGSLSGPYIADLFRGSPQRARLLPSLSSFNLAVAITLLVNALLLLMSTL